MVDAETACAAACALFHEDNPLRRDGSLSKRCRERILALVPELSEETGGGDPLGALAAGFQGAGLLSFRGDGRGALDPVRLAAAADAWKDRLPFFLAAASATLGFQPRGDPGPTEPASALADRARLLETLAACLPGGSAVSEEGLRRAALLAGRFLGMSGASQADYAVEALRRFGLVRSGARGFVRAAPRRRPGGRPEGKRTAPVLVVEASHAVQVLPEADPSERAFAGVVARLEARGEVWSCVLDRRSARRALDAGFGADYMARTFEELSGRPLPQSLAFSLAGWEKEYLSVRLYSGILLAADGPARTLAENAPALKRLLGERVSEGVWLLSSEDPAEARSALESAGLHAPRLRRAGEMYSERKDLPGAPPGAGSPPWAAALAAGGPERERRPQEALDRLRRALDSAGLPEERRVELAERISRRLVLTEDQLSRAETGGPRLEAGALDYLGKVRVVERVLRRPGALLELLFRKQDGEPERIRVRPLELEKTDKGLVLRAADPGDGSVRVLAVSSLSHVRWIKTTLFGEDNECDDK